jgi:hypothetical protein
MSGEAKQCKQRLRLSPTTTTWLRDSEPNRNQLTKLIRCLNSPRFKKSSKIAQTINSSAKTKWTRIEDSWTKPKMK